MTADHRTALLMLSCMLVVTDMTVGHRHHQSARCRLAEREREVVLPNVERCSHRVLPIRRGFGQPGLLTRASCK